jgi:hypothetical protein
MGASRRGFARRIGISIALLGLVVLAGVHYDSAEPRHLDQPTQDELAADYDRYVGQEALLFGTVLDRGDGWLSIRVESDRGPFEVRVTEVPDGVAVDPGGAVQVYGPLEDGREIAATDVVVVNEGPSSLAYKYAVSLAGVGLFLVAFARYWTVDWRELAVVPRTDG